MRKQPSLCILGLMAALPLAAQRKVEVVKMPAVAISSMPVVKVEQPIEIKPAQVSVTNFPPNTAPEIPPPDLFRKDEVLLYWPHFGADSPSAQVKVLDRQGNWVHGEYFKCGHGGTPKQVWFYVPAMTGSWSVGICRN